MVSRVQISPVPLLLILFLSICFSYSSDFSKATYLYSVFGETDGYAKIYVPFSSDFQKVEQITSYPLNYENNLTYSKFQGNFNFTALIDVTSPLGVQDIGLEKQDFYVQETKYIDFSPEIRAKAAELLLSSKSRLDFLSKVVEYVYSSMKYDSNYTDLVPASQVFKEKRGVCAHYSLLSAALLRSAGIPTKYVQGISYSSEGAIPHAWIEVYFDGVWIPSDPTNGLVFAEANNIKIKASADPSDVQDYCILQRPNQKCFFNFSVQLLNKTSFQKQNVTIFTEQKVPKNSIFEVNFSFYNPSNISKVLPVFIMSSEIFSPLERYFILVANPHENITKSIKVKTSDVDSVIGSMFFTGPGLSKSLRIEVVKNQSSKPFLNLSIIPKVRVNDILFEISITNLGNERTVFNLSIQGSSFNYSTVDVISPSEVKKYSIGIPKEINELKHFFNVSLSYDSEILIQPVAIFEEEQPFFFKEYFLILVLVIIFFGFILILKNFI
ncbi:MAG: transglutaminase-like domain-containing protein [archaeon]